MKQRFLIIGMLVFGSIPTFGYLEDYGPFDPGHEPKACPIAECLCVTSSSNAAGRMLEQVFLSDTDSSVRVVMDTSEDSAEYWDSPQYIVRVEDISGKQLLEPIKIDGGFVYGLTVYSGFLNEDEQIDYMVQTWSGGCGLAAGYSYLSFLLSSGASFRVVPVITLNPTENDFVDLNGDGRAEFIHTAFVYGEKGKDGKVHNYWVYNALQFKNDRVVSANHLDRRLPCWVWFTFKANHKNTVQLTKEQKKKLWKKQASDLFPKAESFADEQER